MCAVCQCLPGRGCKPQLCLALKPRRAGPTAMCTPTPASLRSPPSALPRFGGGGGQSDSTWRCRSSCTAPCAAPAPPFIPLRRQWSTTAMGPPPPPHPHTHTRYPARSPHPHPTPSPPQLVHNSKIISPRLPCATRAGGHGGRHHGCVASGLPALCAGAQVCAAAGGFRRGRRLAAVSHVPQRWGGAGGRRTQRLPGGIAGCLGVALTCAGGWTPAHQHASQDVPRCPVGLVPLFPPQARGKARWPSWMPKTWSRAPWQSCSSKRQGGGGAPGTGRVSGPSDGRQPGAGSCGSMPARRCPAAVPLTLAELALPGWQRHPSPPLCCSPSPADSTAAGLTPATPPPEHSAP